MSGKGLRNPRHSLPAARFVTAQFDRILIAKRASGRPSIDPRERKKTLPNKVGLIEPGRGIAEDVSGVKLPDMVQPDYANRD
jgi:hypothetical protein